MTFGLLPTLVSVALVASVEPIEIYVATDGNDAWSGALPAPNTSGDDGPLATLTAARDAVRKIRADKPHSPTTVWVRGGRYALADTFILTAEDSGSAGAPVTYAAYHDETPVLSGGVELTDWQVTELNGRTVWRAQAPDGGRGMRQLFIDGERQPRARLPKTGWYQLEGLPDVTDETEWNQGQTRFTYAEGDLEAWDDAQDGEIIALHFWTDSHLPIVSVDESTRVVELSKRSVFRLTTDHGKEGAFYSVENVAAALTEPGEWLSRDSDGAVYYLPKPGEVIDSFVATVPRLTQLVRFDGEPETARFVEHVVLRGLTFSHCEWWFGPEYEPTWPNDDIGGMVQAAFAVPGAIRLRGARSCRIEQCAVMGVGTYAVELERGCQDNAVVHNTLTDLGAGGVKVGETTIRENGGEQTHRNQITDNVIAAGGRLFHSAVGIWVGHSGGNVLAHNDIHDFYYTAISVGWSWGYGRSLSAHNRIEFNHIHTIGQGWLSDMGAIYTLGVSPGMTIRNNHIHDIVSRRYGGWGIYPDEGTSHAVIENNVVYRTNRCGFHLHYGKDNLVSNNIFAYTGEAQICRTREDPFSFRGNIVYWEDGSLLGGRWDSLNVTIDGNLYWNAAGSPITPAGHTWDEWQKLGMDETSIIADPLFVDPANDDFRLQDDSPAWMLGFRPIDLGNVGPRKAELTP
ncbi:hypothetical protein HN371_28140 [Candidatus Poribacteria bacterium]|jgi:parallel beta-helix repeat protein|nr:hypothetical protein [Candidatus Poribacteria bacterium]MBT5536881.1 hypothetical protein [Candidatus Poribacteria bacterium]MBT5711860.1 hypothetical protein [Candidatus Poribacteria bacterium]MBT7101066.1 hypothetical protein [Candidatus Poribacteria bacterium]MBT7809288.1 hypothetical protein [Candidatus Poribacteria bacterium]